MITLGNGGSPRSHPARHDLEPRWQAPSRILFFKRRLVANAPAQRSQRRLILSCFMKRVTSRCSHLRDGQASLRLDSESPSELALMSSRQVPHRALRIPLLSGTKMCPRLPRASPCPGLSVGLFPRGSGEGPEEAETWAPGVLTATGRPSLQPCSGAGPGNTAAVHPHHHRPWA